MGNAKKIISGMAWTTIQNIVNVLYGFIAVPILINNYGKEEYGLIGLAMSINAYVTLLDMGMTNSNVRFFSEYITKGDSRSVQRLFGLTHLFYLVLGFLNSIILFGVSFYVENLFKVTPEQSVILRNLLWILALNATFSWTSVCFDQFLRANELIDWIKRRATFLKLMLFIVLFCSIIFKWSIELYFFGYIFMGTIILPLTIIKAHRVYPSLHFSFHFDREMFRTILPYAISIFSFSIFGFFVSSSRPLFLGNMIGPGAVAEFNVISAISGVVTIFTTSIIQVLLPILTKMQVSNDSEGVQNIMLRGTKLISVFLSGLIFAMVISAKDLLTIYVGTQFVELTPWLIVACLTFLLGHRNVMTALVFTERKLSSVAIMCSVAMTLAIVCYYFLVPVYGVGGVVVGYLIHEIIHTIFYYIYYLPRRFHIDTGKIFIYSVLPSWLILGITAVGICLIFSELTNVWLAIFVRSIVYSLVAILITWNFIFNKEDKLLIHTFIYKH